MKTNLRRCLAGLAACVALVSLGGAAEASATSPGTGSITAATTPTWYHGASPTSGCTGHYGSLCAYYDLNFGGTTAYFAATNPAWSQTANAFMNDKSSSWFNNGQPATLDSVRIFNDVNYLGTSQCLDRGWGIKYWAELNDKVSSNKWVAGPC